jgi:hypothetical protein
LAPEYGDFLRKKYRLFRRSKNGHSTRKSTGLMVWILFVQRTRSNVVQKGIRNEIRRMVSKRLAVVYAAFNEHFYRQRTNGRTKKYKNINNCIYFWLGLWFFFHSFWKDTLRSCTITNLQENDVTFGCRIWCF